MVTSTVFAMVTTYVFVVTVSAAVTNTLIVFIPAGLSSIKAPVGVPDVMAVKLPLLTLT